jgi:hypothetical protein
MGMLLVLLFVGKDRVLLVGKNRTSFGVPYEFPGKAISFIDCELMLMLSSALLCIVTLLRNETNEIAVNSGDGWVGR